MAADSRPVVELTGVGHRYAATTALAAVDLTLPGGGMVGLIGPDGVGKSTLLGLMAGVRRLQQGRVRVLNGEVSDRHHRHTLARRIAYMPQGLGRNLYMTLSVFENADFFGRLFGLTAGQRRSRIAELLTATGLAPFTDRPAGQLSGGMKQKLGLCCALIHDPDLLILDEPTTGVDPLSRRQFWELIDRLRARRPGMTVIVATAYMEEAAAFDRLVMMDGGRLLATGTPEELLARTGADSLEAAFIALLPEQRRRGHQRLIIPPPPPGRDGEAIEARQLTRRFGSFTAVDRVSFTIRRGEIFGFLGSNGCGKTTTMKMLTGLLPASQGEARLFGRPVDAGDRQVRHRIGYMSQSFSLYGELTVAQNLDLHARLFHLPAEKRRERIDHLVERFELAGVLEQRAEGLPLGLRQRLSLAVAVIHEPQVLILDEPTSGVDPVARDRFWALLIDLSRHQGVTIFISTHFMNEAERCDRISLMHAGRVLAQDAPAALVAASGRDDLEGAFIHYLEQARQEEPPAPTAALPVAGPRTVASGFSPARLLAFARRETLELLRDPIRLGFALGGTLLLMVVMGLGISLDVEHLSYAALDQDRTPASRDYLANFAGSRYFRQQAPADSPGELTARLQAGEIRVGIEIPAGFGRALKAGDPTQVAFWIDGSMPFRSETVRGYVQGVHQRWLQDLDPTDTRVAAPARVETRLRYNQAFRSIYAMAPGVVALLLLVIPATLTAVGVVREKELGSITNLYASPANRVEFLLGKQLPYIGLGLVNYLLLLGVVAGLFQVPLKGSLVALTLGAVLYVTAATAWGLLISAFTRTQIAALFGAFILTMLPSITFSGLLSPVSSLTGVAAVIGHGFPAAYFHQISVGVFTKALGVADLLVPYLALVAFIGVYLTLSLLLVRTREP